MMEIAFNFDRDTQLANESQAFDKVLFVSHMHWHGIRSAVGALPGHKLCIPHEGGSLDGSSARHIIGIIVHHNISHVCFHGFSPVAEWLARDLKKHFGSDLGLSVVTHVTSSQFENHFEIEMQRRIQNLQKLGVFRRHGSVKPNFDSVVETCWARTLINAAPNISPNQFYYAFDPDSVFIPLENTWRKNLYTNIISANALDQVKRINTVNWPSSLENLLDLSKVRHVGYKRGFELYSTMASASVMLGVTLAECQPMTELEGLAVGTPTISGQLLLSEFADDELTKLTRVSTGDNPRSISQVLDSVMNFRRSSPDELQQMISEHLQKRLKLSFESYRDFLEI